MKKIQLDIAALSHSVTQSHNFAIILKEHSGVRRLPIIIGQAEAQSIAVALENLEPSRPLTHDLFKNTLDIFGIELKEVVINDLTEGIFYARLVCSKEGENMTIDSRASDAMALAVRFGCPIYTYDAVMDAAGIIFENPDENEDVVVEEASEERSLSSFTKEELDEMLQDMISREDYEGAAEVRDEINKRKTRQR